MPRTIAHDLAATRGWLGATSPDFCSAVLARCSVVRVPAGRGFAHDGPGPDGLYGIVAGAVDIVLAVPGTTGRLLHVARPGYWFGQGAFVHPDDSADAPRHLGFIARENAILYRLAPEHVDNLVAEAPGNWRHFAALVREHAGLAVSHVAVLLIDQPARRVAYQLLRLLRHRQEETLAIVQADLGATVGLSRNCVNRVLGELTERGLLRIGYGRVEIVDAAALEDFCWQGAVLSG